MQDLQIRAGVFHSEPGADRAVTDLLAAGFPKDRISVVSAKPLPPHDEHESAVTVEPSGSHTWHGVAIGGTVGSVLGAAAASVGVALTGGMGLLVVGPLMASATAGGLTGGFIGAMMTRGFEPEVADYYDQALTKGQYLVAVEAAPQGPNLDLAAAVLEHAGALPMAMHKG